MSRAERLRDMIERRRQWQTVPHCSCGRVLPLLGKDGLAPCERCLTLSGDVTVDAPAAVTTAFQRAVRMSSEELIDEALAMPSIWDERLSARPLTARVVSASANGQRGWWVLRLTPSFGADAERFSLATSAVHESVRVVLAGVAPDARVRDVRTGRTLIIAAA